MAVGVVGAAVMAVRHAVAVTVPAAGCVAPAATVLRPHGLAVHIAGTRLDPVAGHPGMAGGPRGPGGGGPDGAAAGGRNRLLRQWGGGGGMGREGRGPG